MRKKIVAVCLVFALAILGACSNTEKSSSTSSSKTSSTKTKEETSKGPLKAEDYDKLYTNPKAFQGYEVELTGQVFNEPEKDNKGTYFQMWGNPEKSERNTLVAIKDPNLQIKTNDYVKVKGIVKDEFNGKNAFGGNVSAPEIVADSVQIVDYITAVAPTIKEVQVNKEINQNNIVITFQKIELAKNQTRVYLSVKNNTQDKASFYANSAKLVVGSQQLEEQYTNPETTGLQEIQSDILPGVETKGVIVYPAIDSSVTSLKLNAEASSDNYELDFQPYVFDVSLN